MNRPIYRLRYDAEELRFESLKIAADGCGMERAFIYPPAILLPRAGPSQPLPDSERSFLTSLLVVTAGEKEQRQAIRRKKARGTRNLALKVRTVAEYLEEYLNPTHLEGCRGKKMKMERLKELLEPALAPLRDELGLPSANPVEFSYLITDEVIACAAGEPCKGYLKRKIPLGPVFEKDFPPLEAHLREAFPKDAEAVIQALRKTQSREHISAVSLTTARDQWLVTLVNSCQQFVTMEGWKLVALLEAPNTARRLQILGQRNPRESEPLFAFNSNKDPGEVIGKFVPTQSTLEVAYQREIDRQIGDRASFILDPDYLLCLAIVLRRLRDDKERFARLMESAQAAEVDDPFPKIFTT